MAHASSAAVASLSLDWPEKVCQEIYEHQSRPSQLVQALERVSAERQQIKESYRAIYGEELVEHLLRVKAAKPESEQVWYGLWLWMMEPRERDAEVAKDAVDGGCADDYKALVEIYVRRKSSHLFLIKQTYLAKFRRHLDKDVLFVESEHPGPKILAALATSHRSHHDQVNQHIANCDARRFHGAMKMSDGGIDESSIVEIFSKRSIPQLRQAFSSYRHIYGHDYIEDLKALETTSGKFKDSLTVIIQCMCAPCEYYSEMIHGSLMGEATKKGALTRMMIGSREAGMNKVKEAFQIRYRVKLEDAISERLHDDEYKDFLLALSNASGLDG